MWQMIGPTKVDEAKPHGGTMNEIENVASMWGAPQLGHSVNHAPPPLVAVYGSLRSTSHIPKIIYE